MEAIPELSENAKNFKTGKYRHFKGGLYEAYFIARHSENVEEEFVVYRSLERDFVWARPLKMFLGVVEVEGKKIPRFEYIS